MNISYDTEALPDGSKVHNLIVSDECCHLVFHCKSEEAMEELAAVLEDNTVDF